MFLSGNFAILVGTLAASVGFFIIAGLRFWSHRRGRLCIGFGLLLYFGYLVAQIFIYGKIGSYIGLSILENAIKSPGALFSHGGSGIDVTEGGFVALLLLIGLAIIRKLLILPRPSHTEIAASFTLALVLSTAAIVRSPMQPMERYLLTEHSLPQVYLLARMSSSVRGSLIDMAPYFPTRRPQGKRAHKGQRPRHILLIIAECLRADRFPHYGYSQITTPHLWENRSDWTVFSRTYAHAPWTTESFPVIFNSNYLASTSSNNTGAAAFWDDLRRFGLFSGYLSADAIEWGGVDTKIALHKTDLLVSPSTIAHEARTFFSMQRFDYAVDDTVIEDAYIDALAALPAEKDSFFTLHLDGTHYPFIQDRSRDRSKMVADNRAMDPRRISADYDRAILGLDRSVERLVKVLKERGILESSLIILTGDHGEAFGEHSSLFHGTTLFEEQVRVPLLIRVGSELGLRPALERNRERVSGLISIIPTIYDSIGMAPNPLHQGRSLLEEDSRNYEILFLSFASNQVGIVTSDRKFIFDTASGTQKTFDLVNDPGELNDISEATLPSVSAFLEDLESRGVITRQINP